MGGYSEADGGIEMATATVPPIDAPKKGNSIGRIFGAIVSPKETFASIVRRPSWLAPLILLCVVQIGVTAIFSRRVGWHSLIERQMQQSPRAQQMTPQRRQQQIGVAAKVAPIIGYVGAVVAPFVGALILGAIFLGVFNLLGGLNLDFKTSLGVVAYAWAPAIIAALLGILVLFLKDPSTVDLRNLVAANAGAFLSDDSPKWLTALATSLDLFPFWTMLLMAAGYGAVNPKKVSFGKAFAWILCVWVIYVAIKVGLTAAFA